MKLTIINKETNEPVLILDEDEQGMKVVGGDPKMVNALKLSQFGDLQEIADYINSDPNSNLQAVGEEGQQQQSEQSNDQKIAPALDILKELMSKVNQRQAKKKADEAQSKPEAKTEASFGAETIAGPGEMLYISYDGDNIGNAVARAEDKDDERELQAMSAKINAGQKIASDWAQKVNGTIIEQGGDEGLIKAPSGALERIEEFRNAYQSVVGATLTVGVGKKISESTKARMLGKLKGKNRVEVYSEETPKELKLREENAGDQEAKKVRNAMTGQPSGPQEIKPEAQDGSVQGSNSADRAEAKGNPPQAQASDSEGAQEEEHSEQLEPNTEDGEDFVNLSPELLKAAAQLMRKEKPTESVLANAYHDPNIENQDFSYSDDPEFSKALRYVVKHGGN